MTGNLKSFAAALRHPFARPAMKTTRQKIAARFLVGPIVAALLLGLAGVAQANTVTLSNGSNLVAGQAIGDLLSFNGVTGSGGTLILDNYKLAGSNSNGNSSGYYGQGTTNQVFTVKNGSYFTMASSPVAFPNVGYGVTQGWSNGASFQIGSAALAGTTLNVESGSIFAIGRRFAVGNNAGNLINVTGAGSLLLNSNANNNNPVGGTWSITNGGMVIAANVSYASSSTFNATVSGTDPTTGLGATWHAISGFNSLNNAANTVTINSGGFLEFEGQAGAAPAPTFSLLNANTVMINGGGLSYGLPQNGQAYSGDLLGSNAGSTLNTIGGFTWSGSNRFRINGGTAGITDNGTTAYTFANNLGAQNYYALDMLGTASISRAITFDGDHGGAIKVSGATATLSGGVTVSGTTPVTVTALGTASTLTGAIGGAGGLAKAGAGSLTIADSMIAYTGDTLVNAGTLKIGNNSLSDTGAVKVANGAFLNLNTGTSDTVGSIWYNGTNLGAGTYAAGSVAWLTGSGSLVVTGGGGASIDHYEVSAIALQTAGSAFSVTVTAKDSGGNTVSDSSTVVTLTGSGGVVFDSDNNGTFGDNTKTLASGTFTISAKTTTAGIGVTLTATDGNTKTGNISGITINAAAASQLVFTMQPSASTVAGVAFAQQPVVKIEDTYGNVVTSGTDSTVSVALTLTTGAGTLGGTYSMTAVAGVADFSANGLNINLIGADKALTATATVAAGTKTATTTPAFEITAAAASQVVFTTQPSASTVAGAAFAQQPVVEIKDALGNVVTSGTDSTVSVALTLTTGTGTLGGTYSMTAVAGVADFADKGLTINLTGTDKVLTATATVAAGTKTATTTPAFAITPAAASVLVFTTQPGGATAGSAFGTQPVVMTRDTYGNDSTVGLAASETVTVAIKTGTGTLQGTPGYDIGTGAGNGIITGSGLRIDQAGSFTLAATGSGLAEAVSASFAVQSQFAAYMGTQSGVPTGAEGFNADANSDGVGNGLAWILGGTAMSDSTGLLPQGTLDAGYLKLFNFKVLKVDKRLGTTLSVQYSSDLGVSDSWHSAGVPSAYGVNTVNDVRFTVTDNNDDYDTIIAEIPQSKALGGGKLFGRLDAIGQ